MTAAEEDVIRAECEEWAGGLLFMDSNESRDELRDRICADPEAWWRILQELAATGTDFIISTKLDPGADPILEAQRRGSILLVIRMGNVDQEAPNTPSLESTNPPQNPMSMLPELLPMIESSPCPP